MHKVCNINLNKCFRVYTASTGIIGGIYGYNHINSLQNNRDYIEDLAKFGLGYVCGPIGVPVIGTVYLFTGKYPKIEWFSFLQTKEQYYQINPKVTINYNESEIFNDERCACFDD